MTNPFLMRLDQIQPSQLYISSDKLGNVLKNFPSKPASIESIPIKKLSGEVVFVDGHTRALAALLNGFSEVPVYWEDEKLDWKAYRICVEWCKEEKIHTIADLKNRVIPHKEYEKLWYERCAKMQKKLKTKRKLKRAKSEVL